MNEHLSINKNTDYNYYEVSCNEGHYITNWDGEDILAFSACSVLFASLDSDISTFYCITKEQYDELMAKQEEAIKEEEKRREEEMRE
jgi:hypothetical protein